MADAIDWYERRDELEQGQIFTDFCGDIVQLDRRVDGDGTKWHVLTWCSGLPGVKGYETGHWSDHEGTIEPSDLVERLPGVPVSAE